MGALLLLGLGGLLLAMGGSRAQAAAPATKPPATKPPARPLPVAPADDTPEEETTLPAVTKPTVMRTKGGGKVTVMPTQTITARAPSSTQPTEAELAARLAEQTSAPPPPAVVNTPVTTSTSPSGVVQATPAELPPGYDAAAARKKAQPTADHIRTRKTKYDKAVLGAFQTAAGLPADGLYGPQTRSALVFFGAKNVPAAMFKGSQKSYAPLA